MTAVTVAKECEFCSASVTDPRRKKYCSKDCFTKHRHQKKKAYDQARYRADPALAKAKVSDWYRQNLDRKREYDRAYRARTDPLRKKASREYRERRALTDPMAGVRSAHRRRANKAANGIFAVTSRDLARLLQRHRNACAYCGASFSEAAPLEWDHIIPISRGGRHSVGNLVPACRKCNRSKMRRTVMEWRTGRVVSHLKVMRQAVAS